MDMTIFLPDDFPIFIEFGGVNIILFFPDLNYLSSVVSSAGRGT